MALCRRNRGKLSTAPSRVEGDRALPRGRGVEGLSSARRMGGKRGSQRRGGAIDETTRFAVFFSRSGGTF